MNSEEPPEERRSSIVERFFEKSARDEAKKRKIKDHVKSKFLKLESGEDSLRSELASSIKMYIADDETRLKDLVSQFPDDWQPRINKYYDFLPTGFNREHKCIRMADLLIKCHTTDEVMKYICDLQLEGFMNASETITWRAFEFKKNPNDPLIEFNERPAIPTLSDDELKSWHRNVQMRFQRALSPKHQSSNLIVKVLQKDEFMMVGLLMAKPLDNKQYDFAVGAAAIVPKLPFICFHGRAEHIIDLNELAKLLPGKYQVVHDLSLEDEGLRPVFSSLLKIPSSTIRQSEEFRRRLSTMNKPMPSSSLQSLPVEDVATVRAQSDLIMKLAIDDGQPGGFKTLNLQYEVPNLDRPVTVRLKAIEGSLDKCIRQKYTAGSWSDPSPYVTAKDRKTNNLTLKHSADSFVVVSNGN